MAYARGQGDIKDNLSLQKGSCLRGNDKFI